MSRKNCDEDLKKKKKRGLIHHTRLFYNDSEQSLNTTKAENSSNWFFCSDLGLPLYPRLSDAFPDGGRRLLLGTTCLIGESRMNFWYDKSWVYI